MLPTKDIFQAIADPTRRQIISMLVHESLNVTTIAKQFDITRQAVSLHVQLLNDCGLIVIRQQGRERYCEVKLEKLDEVSDWVEESKKIWLSRFQLLELFLGKLQTQKKSSIKKKKHGKRK